MSRQSEQANALDVFQHEQRMTLAEVCALLKCGKSWLYAQIKAGAFPLPEKRGRKFSRWRAGDVLAYLRG